MSATDLIYTTEPFAGHSLRVFGTPEEPLFLVQEVCEVLGISKHRDAYARLREVHKGRPVRVDGPGGAQDYSTIREPGVYYMAFRSNRPNAVAFQDWVCEKVLPAIRKTGSYSAPGAEAAAATLPPAEALDLLCHAGEVLQAMGGTLSELGTLRGAVLEVALRSVGVTPAGVTPARIQSQTKLSVTDAAAMLGVHLDARLRDQVTKQAASLYRARHGRQPEREVRDYPNGETWPVNVYGSSDHDLLERVLDEAANPEPLPASLNGGAS